jgi:hypothetical protein
MTRRSLGCCVPNRISVHWRSRVWLLGTTGLPVGLHEEISRFSDYTFFETRVSFSSACAGDYNIGGEGMRNPGEPPFQQWI